MSILLPELPELRRASSRLVVRAESTSTNTELVAAAAASPEEWRDGAVLVTFAQSAGRGRLGREWTAPKGTMAATSVLLRVPAAVPAERLGWLSIAAGLAMAEAVSAATGATAELKWPNDVLVAGKKICGVLGELVPAPVGAGWTLVIGAGLNTSMTQAQLPVETATSLEIVAGRAVPVDPVLAAFVSGLRARVAALIAAEGDASAAGLMAEAGRVCVTIGQRVRIMLPGGGEQTGTCTGIDAEARVLITPEGSDAELAFAAGDVVHLRPSS